jgi:23S rRNA (cytosine1962-C5)-methyltransferase
VRVTAAAERALRGGHPWLFEGSIREQSREGRPGDLAVVFDRRGRFLAVGLYDPLSVIRVRLLQHRDPAPIDRHWFYARLAAAHQRRAPLRDQDIDGYRVVHGENDGLPALVVDRYAGTLVLKLYTAAWLPHLRDVLPALLDVVPAERVVLRLGRAVRAHQEYLHGLREGVLLGPPLEGPVVFREYGLRFEVDPIHGQKTGFFLDQRENRRRVEQRARGKSTLNVFAYSGAFSVYAARGGAPRALSVDQSEPALEAARRNFERNRDHPAVAAAEHRVLAGDAFEMLEALAGQGRRFDLVIIDPPAFATRQDEVAGALAAYRRLTRMGLAVLSPGGTLVTASCSRPVERDAFFAAVHRAAGEAGRPLRELERTGHPLDHPIGFPEGAYLKCLFATVP